MPKKYRYMCKHCHELPKVRGMPCTSGGKIKVVKCECRWTPPHYISYAIWMSEYAVGSDPIQEEMKI